MKNDMLKNAITLVRLGELQQAWSAAERLASETPSGSGVETYWRCRFVIAEVLRIRGRVEEAARYLESLGSPEQICIYLVAAWRMHRGYCLGLLGEYGECK
jgi:hypothetical protein